jgi:hypothetical protein
MSWVTTVLLIFSLAAVFYDDDGEEIGVENLPALENINAWLQKNGRGILDNLDERVISSGKAMQACVYGGAFNFLKVDEFIEVVKAQSWRERSITYSSRTGRTFHYVHIIR